MQYNIPENYNQQGKLLNGLLETRNCIEAGIVAYLGYYIIFRVIPITTAERFMAYAITVLPIVIFLVIGIGGDSVLQKLHIIWKHRKSKRMLHYQIQQEARTEDKRNRKKKTRKHVEKAPKAQKCAMPAQRKPAASRPPKPPRTNPAKERR